MDGSTFRTALIFVLIAAAFGLAFRKDIEQGLHRRSINQQTISQTATPPDEVSLRPVYERLKMAPLPTNLASDATIATALKGLINSVCDKTAIFSLATELAKVGERRLAANFLLGFAGACSNSEGEQYRGADILFGLGDYTRTISVTDKLIEDRPEVGQYYFLRAQALNYLGRYEESTRDISSAIGLFPNVKNVNSEAFRLLASGYAALHRYCEAKTAIETYVYADLQARDFASTRKLIDDYASKGNCTAGYADGTEVVPRTRPGVILAKAKINGVTGYFIVDTGASMVTLTSSFAAKAKVGTNDNQKIVMNTVNGVSDAALTYVDTIELGQVKARGVSAAIVPKPIGPGIDGLLGMSFLARFDVAILPNELRLQSRKVHG